MSPLTPPLDTENPSLTSHTYKPIWAPPNDEAAQSTSKRPSDPITKLRRHLAPQVATEKPQFPMAFPSNHMPCDMQSLLPCLCPGEFCLANCWSRDKPREHPELGCQAFPFDQIANSGRTKNSFVNDWNLSSNTLFEDTFDENGGGFGIIPSITGSEDPARDTGPENYGSREGETAFLYVAPRKCFCSLLSDVRNREDETPEIVSNQMDMTAVDYPSDERAQRTYSLVTAANPRHFRAKPQGYTVCHECFEHFPHKSALDKHATQTQHGGYACGCGGTFTRLDSLDRHIQTSESKTFYPCNYCSKVFTRPDHLTQHLRGYHKMENLTKEPHSLLGPKGNARSSGFSCPHENCSHHQVVVDSSTPFLNPPNADINFRTQRDLTKHLREAHDESLYPCPVSGCDRIRGRGFCRKRDLLKHQNNHRVFPDSSFQEP